MNTLNIVNAFGALNVKILDTIFSNKFYKCFQQQFNLNIIVIE